MMKNMKITVLAALVAIFAVNCSADPVTTPTSTASSEGSVAAPVVITRGTAHNGTISGFAESYYSLAVTVGTPVTCTVTNMTFDVDLDIYENANFVSNWAANSWQSGLTPETATWTPTVSTAYVMVSAFGNGSTNPTYTVTCN